MSDEFICPERAKLTSVEELCAHDWIGCDRCHQIRVRERLGLDEEIIFPEGVPPWATYFSEEEAKTNQLPERSPIGMTHDQASPPPDFLNASRPTKKQMEEPINPDTSPVCETRDQASPPPNFSYAPRPSKKSKEEPICTTSFIKKSSVLESTRPTSTQTFAKKPATISPSLKSTETVKKPSKISPVKEPPLSTSPPSNVTELTFDLFKPICATKQEPRAVTPEIEPNPEVDISYGQRKRITHCPAAEPSTSTQKPNQSKQQPQKKVPENKPHTKSKSRLDKEAVRDIMNLQNVSKEEAAQILLQRRLEEAEKEGRPEKQKAEVEKDQMPWTPKLGFNHLESETAFRLPKNCRSALTYQMHRRYVAILTNFLKADAKARFVYNEVDLKNFDMQMASERAQFNKEILKNLRNVPRFGGSPYRYISPGAFEFIKTRIMAKLSTLSPRGYSHIIKELDWADSHDIVQTSAYPHKTKIINEGLYAEKLIIPDVSRKCVFSLVPDELSEAFPVQKITQDLIEDDRYAMEMAVEHGVDVVMNACAARHFLVQPWPNRSEDHILKVTVKRQIHQGKIVRVIFIGKPIPSSTLSRMTCLRQFMKYVVRLGVRKPAEKKGDPMRIPAFMRKRHHSEKQIPKFHPTAKKSKHPENEEGNLMIADSEDDSKSPEIKRKMQSPKKELQPVGHIASNDVLSGILGGMGVLEQPSQKETSKEEFNIQSLFQDLRPEQISENHPQSSKRYAIYSFDGKGKKSILIRSSVLGKDTHKVTTSITSKVEYLPQTGAEMTTKEEILWNAITSVFKGSEQHCNFYMHFETGDVLQITRRNAASALQSLKPEHRQLLQLRSERLCSLIDALHELDFGEHLIHQSKDKLKIFREADHGEENVPLTIQSLEHRIFDGNAEPPAFEEIFQGIDPHLVLQWHIIQGRAPGSFFASRGGAFLLFTRLVLDKPFEKNRKKKSNSPRKASTSTVNTQVTDSTADFESPGKKSSGSNSRQRGKHNRRGHHQGRWNRGRHGKQRIEDPRVSRPTSVWEHPDWDAPENTQNII